MLISGCFVSLKLCYSEGLKVLPPSSRFTTVILWNTSPLKSQAESFDKNVKHLGVFMLLIFPNNGVNLEADCRAEEILWNFLSSYCFRRLSWFSIKQRENFYFAVGLRGTTSNLFKRILGKTGFQLFFEMLEKWLQRKARLCPLSRFMTTDPSFK